MDTEEQLERQRRSHMIVSNFGAAQIPIRYQGLRFEHFKTEKDQKKEAVLEACKEFVDGEYEGGLIMVGNNGTGKSMLCALILQEIIREDPDDNRGYDSHKRRYTEAIKMVRAIKDSWRLKTSEQDVIEQYISPEVLVIDEMGVQYGSATEAQFITEIINDRYNEMKRTILCGNVTIPEITKLVGDRVIDRFRENGRTLSFGWKSYRGK